MLVGVNKMTMASVLKCGPLVVRPHGLRLEITQKSGAVFSSASVSSRVALVEKMFSGICVSGAFMNRSLPVHVMKTVEMMRELPISALKTIVSTYVTKTVSVDEGCPKYIR